MHALKQVLNEERLGIQTMKAQELNVHKAYNIRVGLFVESLVSSPSSNARQQKKEENSFSIKQQAVQG